MCCQLWVTDWLAWRYRTKRINSNPWMNQRRWYLQRRGHAPWRPIRQRRLIQRACNQLESVSRSKTCILINSVKLADEKKYHQIGGDCIEFTFGMDLRQLPTFCCAEIPRVCPSRQSVDVVKTAPTVDCSVVSLSASCFEIGRRGITRGSETDPGKNAW